MLTTHIRNNVVDIRGKLWRQTTGIPQGSLVSTLLCNFFYGHFERSLGLNDPALLQVRFIDDFLYVSTRKELIIEAVTRFADRCSLEYGIMINWSKSISSFPLKVGDTELAPSRSHRTFTWCNMAIEQRTLDVQAKALPSEDMLWAQRFLTKGNRPISQYLAACYTTFRANCLPLYLSMDLNRFVTVHRNFRRIVTLCAKKLRYALATLPYQNHLYLQKVIDDLVDKFADFTTRTIKRSPRNKRLRAWAKQLVSSSLKFEKIE